MLNCNRVMHSVRDDGIVRRIVMERCQQRSDIWKYRFVELDAIGRWRKVCDPHLTEVRSKHECIVSADRCCACGARAGGLIRGDVRMTLRPGCVDNRSVVAVVRKMEIILRVVS